MCQQVRHVDSSRLIVLKQLSVKAVDVISRHWRRQETTEVCYLICF